MPPHTEESHLPAQNSFTILHHSKNKQKQLTSSLMLASTLISNKHKISKARQTKSSNEQHITFVPLLTTNRINMSIGDKKWQGRDSQRVYSNIQELKYHARKLEEEKVVKMGKENVDRGDSGNYPECAIELPHHQIRQRKMNKRKIVKGRPQMYALIKKRKFLTSLNEQPPTESNSFIYDQGHIRQTINQILHKHHQAEVYGQKYQTPQSINEQFCGFKHQKTEELVQIPTKNRRATLRNSVSSFNTIENSLGRGRMLAHDITSPLIRPKQRQLSLVHRRFSVSNTLE